MALIRASSEDREHEIPLLVSLGAEVGYNLEEQPNLAFFPLLIATLEGQEKVVRALLSRPGPSPASKGGSYRGRPSSLRRRTTSLNNSLDVVKLLVRARGIARGSPLCHSEEELRPEIIL
jgi:hypothetical protein